jgi:hypothetical protein
MGYNKPPKRDDGRVRIDPIERGRPREDKEMPGGRKRKPKPPITIMPVPKRPARKSGRNR